MRILCHSKSSALACNQVMEQAYTISVFRCLRFTVGTKASQIKVDAKIRRLGASWGARQSNIIESPSTNVSVHRPLTICPNQQMADWKFRGFVADSDDDEDSQASIITQPAISQKNSAHVDDIRPHEIDGEHNACNDGDESGQVATLSQVDGNIEPVDNEDIGVIEQSSSASGEYALDNARKPVSVVEAHNDVYVPIGDYEDIDELQDDHYKDTTSSLSGINNLRKLYAGKSYDVPIQARTGHDSGASFIASSPLSMVPSTLSSPDTKGIKAQSSLTARKPVQSGCAYDISEPSRPPTSPPAFLIPEDDSVYNRPSRSLRHRNAIQLHPYLIESEKYRQSLKARGLRPLRMGADSVCETDQGPQNAAYCVEESQLNDHEADLETSSPLRSQESSIKAGAEQSDHFVPGEDYLPDMNALLQYQSRNYVGNGYKRRKTASTDSQKIPESIPDRPAPMVIIPTSQHNEDFHNIPPSPPYSAMETPLKAYRTKKPKFRMPQAPVPAKLPTPVTSSEPRRQAFPYSDSESSEDEVRSRNQSTVVDRSPDKQRDLFEDESSRNLQRVQRKIRGVLPASWLKLDLKSQKKKVDSGHRNETNTSPNRQSTQRWVARPTTLPHEEFTSSIASQNSFIQISDNEDDISVNEELLRRPTIWRGDEYDLDNDEPFKVARLGEATEDDQVDAMIPTISRVRVPRQNRKIQRKLADLTSKPSIVAPMKANKPPSQRRIRPSPNGNYDKGHKRKPISRPPKLSILDASSMWQTPDSTAPHFLKIASRTTRARNDKGRHSPSRKYLRLATKCDDDDMFGTMQEWWKGKIAPSWKETIPTANLRQPLILRSNNASLPLSEINLQATSGKLNSGVAMMKNTKTSVQSKRSRNIQTSLNDMVHRHREKRSAGCSSITERLSMTDDKVKKRGQIVSSLQASKDSRPALLESTRGDGNKIHAQATFQRDLTTLKHFDDTSGLPNVIRFLGNEQVMPRKSIRQSLSQGDRQRKTTIPIFNDSKTISHRSKKRPPRRFEIPIAWTRSSHSPPVEYDVTDNASPSHFSTPGNSNVLLNLGPYGTRYSVNFDVLPLPIGTCFHKKSLLGSGLFATSLQLPALSAIANPKGFSVWNHDGRMYKWGSWNEAVSSELAALVALLTQESPTSILHSQGILGESSCQETVTLLRTMIDYFSTKLNFLDLIDRLTCVQKSRNLVLTLRHYLEREITGLSYGDQRINSPQHKSRVALSTHLLVFTNQILQLADHEVIPRRSRDEITTLVQEIAKQTLSLAFKGHMNEFAACLSRMKNATSDSYILDQEHAIEAFIITCHIYNQQPVGRPSILQVLQEEIPARSIAGDMDAGELELSWKKLFTLLPFMEFDLQGILETGRRFKTILYDWQLVRCMISPVLEISLANPRGQAPSFNAYCRALYSRCLCLINDWSWRRCDAIIGTLFDFFARNSLGHLRNEESHGSPLFLERLDQKPSLNAEPEDRCFHVLLKIIGSGLKYMTNYYSEKKIRDIVCRLMPNHGRFHPKERSIRQEDLDALRNHHDLISILYWASPVSCRPKLAVIRNLVHLETSHREACHINIRAWFNLVKFQQSTNEPIVGLRPFAEWYDELLQQILRQHAFARSEAEEQVRSVQHTGGFTISEEILESTIAINRNQVEAILSDALVSLKLVIDVAPNYGAASMLISPTLSKVFELFDSRRIQANKNVTQALEVILSTANKYLDRESYSNDNDDSQDYGDWSAFEDDTNAKQTTDAASTFCMLHEPLRHLLSNSFGADQSPEDSFLITLIEVWIAVAKVLVHSGTRYWTDYIDRFGNDTWSSLMDTEQSRKFTAYYLTTLIEQESVILHEHPSFFFTSWIGSLVERESRLKFQNRLTQTLLNTKSKNPLLQNLPFSRDLTTGSFHITAGEFSERRLSLISSVLSNMRVAQERAVFDPTIDASSLRHEYKEYLKHLMGTMKHNYQQLGHGMNTKGAYVEFVHRVVEFLQQHTSIICPVDKYFTDNGAFPLPAADPTYVVGQLKNYALRLQDLKTPKQLIIFLQSISERAAVDSQQPYLVNQLHAAISNVFEDDAAAAPTLRSFIIKAVVPAYISLAFTTESGWILALPYFEALRRVFNNLLTDLDGCNSGSVNAVASIITTLLNSMRRSLAILTYPSALLQQPQVLKTLSAYYTTTTALLPILDYLTRLSGPTDRAVDDIEFLQTFATYTSILLNDQHDAIPPEIDDFEDTTYADVRNFASQELRDTLTKNWVCRDGQYHVVRGASRREVVVDIGSPEQERQHLFNVFDGFRKCLAVMPALGDEDDRIRALRIRRRDVRLDELFPRF